MQNNNTIKIGDKNKIKNSTIQQSKENSPCPVPSSEKWSNKLLWKCIIPIIVAVVSAIICVYLGLK